MSYVHVPAYRVCRGQITSVIDNSETYEVSIYNSPIGNDLTLAATAIYQPGLDVNYKQGDYVSVMVMFTTMNGKFIDIHPGERAHIIGLHNERAAVKVDVSNPLTKSDVDKIRFVNKNSGAGITASDSGETRIASGPIYKTIKAFGFGTEEHADHTHAQNHHRVIANAGAPYYLSREYFGMYTGKDENEQATKTSPDDFYICYKRFVTQTMSPDNWVSTCEGSWNPWVGANNNAPGVSKRKEILLSKIINHGSSRVTIEAGEPGDSFINIRVDDVKVSEKFVPVGPGAVTGLMGSRFSLKISDQGAVDMKAAGKGIPASASAGFNLSITPDGEVKFLGAKKITFSHGDSDTAINSIVMDPGAGIDITAKNGFRVNGLEVVNKNFLNWLVQNAPNLCGPIAIGPVAPMFPAALTTLNVGIASPLTANGFTTMDKGPPALGQILYPDAFSTVG